MYPKFEIRVNNSLGAAKSVFVYEACISKQIIHRYWVPVSGMSVVLLSFFPILLASVFDVVEVVTITVLFEVKPLRTEEFLDFLSFVRRSFAATIQFEDS